MPSSAIKVWWKEERSLTKKVNWWKKSICYESWLLKTKKVEENQLTKKVKFTESLDDSSSLRGGLKQNAYFMTSGKFAIWPSYPYLIETKQAYTIL